MIILEFPKELETRLNTEAQRLGITQNDFIQQTIIAYLEDVAIAEAEQSQSDMLKSR